MLTGYSVRMQQSTKAALLSGLVFPGIGHLVQKRYLRGSILILTSLTALSVMITIATRQAMTILDRMYSGEIPVDSEAIADMVASSGNGADTTLAHLALVVLGICWLVGIIDTYRFGRT